MRKELTLWRFALAVLSVSICGGCTKTTTDGAEEDLVPMRFGVSGIATRTVVNGASDLQQPGKAFDVWGTYARTASGGGTTGQTFKVFDATQVTYDGSAWTYDDPQYWFPGFTYNFRALYPSGIENVTFDGSSLKIQNFDATQSIDLLLASPDAISCGSKPMEKVNLSFTHLLSRVVFVGRSDEKKLGIGRKIEIDKAVLSGIRTTGDWNGTDWTPTGEATTCEATNLELATDGTNLFTDELFIPQTIDEDCKLTITFHYNVGQYKQFTREVLLSTISKTWEAGKSYRYPFTIDEHIFFETPTLAPWEYAPINGTNFNVDHRPD